MTESTTTTTKRTEVTETSSGELLASPTRLQRLEEKNELRDLNQRLEFYILKIKEKDALYASAMEHIKELQNQYAAELAARTEEVEKDKQSILDEWKKTYDDTLTKYRQQLEAVACEKTALEERIKGGIQELDALRFRAEQTASERDKLAVRVQELEKQMANAASKVPAEVAEKIEIIKKMKEAYRRKEDEFDALLDTKIQLASEIEQYRRLLEGEESRLNLDTPVTAKKRRRRDQRSSTMPSSGESSPLASDAEGSPRATTAPLNTPEAGSFTPALGRGTVVRTAFDAQSEQRHFESSIDSAAPPPQPARRMSNTVIPAVLISGIDSAGQFLTLRNTTTKALPIAGWKLKNAKGDKYMTFPPNAGINPGAHIRVWCEAPKEMQLTGSDIVWRGEHKDGEEVLWDRNGEKVMLLSPKDDIIHEVTIVPKADEPMDAAQHPQASCMLM